MARIGAAGHIYGWWGGGSPGSGGRNYATATARGREIDRPCPPHYSGRMSKTSPQQAIDQDLKRLEYRIEELIRSVERLKEENRSLRVQQDTMTTERAQLIERNELARTRVEAMINRLKAMEHSA